MATAKTAAADYMVQKYIEKRDKIDRKRVALFTIFGFTYFGCFQWWLYVKVFQKWFPNMASFANQSFREKMRSV